MQLQFGTITLADGDRSQASSGLQVVTQGSVQIAPRIRSTNAESYNRRNYRTEVSFSVDELHSTLDDAEVHVETHAEVLKGQGTADLKFKNTGTESWRALKNAQVVSVSASYIGLTTRTTYSFSGEYIQSP